MLFEIFASKLKGIIGKWLSTKLYLKTGYHADICVKTIELNDSDDKVEAHLDIQVNTTSAEFYRIIEELAK